MKAVIYARYSSDSQREESIEGQLRECGEFAEKNGITVLRSYIDRAFSAKTDNRPAFQEMIRDSSKRLFDVVIVWKLDRFARNRYDSARYKAALKKNGVKVMSATEVISSGAEGIILESVLEGYAEYYSADLSEKVIRGMTENALKCKYNGGTLPIGYIVDEEQHFQIDPLVAPYVLEAYKMYANGSTMREVKRWLTVKGVTNKLGRPLGDNAIQLLLKNRRYIGEFKFRDTVIPDGIPAIVPKDLFDRVQERMEKNKKSPARFKAEEDYLLTTKLFCGHCGALMFGESGTSHTQTTYRYYKCANTKRKKTCHKKPVRKNWVEDLVVNQTMKIAMDDEAIEAIVAMVMDLQERENTDLPLYEKQLAETNASIDNMLTAIQMGILTRSTKERLEALEATREDLEIKIANEKIAKPKITPEFVTFWLHKFRKLDVEKETHRKMLVDTFVNAVYLYDDKIVVTFNYKDNGSSISLAAVTEAAGNGSDMVWRGAPALWTSVWGLFLRSAAHPQRHPPNFHRLHFSLHTQTNLPFVRKPCNQGPTAKGSCHLFTFHTRLGAIMNYELDTLDEGHAVHLSGLFQTHQVQHGGSDISQTTVLELDVCTDDAEGDQVGGVSGVGLHAVVLEHTLGIAVVGGDEGDAAHLGGGLHHVSDALVNGGDSLGCSIIDTGMTDHVAVCVVEDDNVILAGLDALHAVITDLESTHLRLEVIGSDLGGGDQAAVLAGELLLDTAVEEEGDVSILLGLSDAELSQAQVGDILAEDLGQLLLGIGDDHVGHGSVIGGGADVVDVEEALLALEALEVGVNEGAGDLTGTVGAEVHEDDGVALTDLGVCGGDDGDHELVGDACVIAGLHCAHGIVDEACLALAVDHSLVGTLHTVPVGVTVHSVVTAGDGSDLCAVLVAGLLHLSHEALAGGGGNVTAVHEAVDEDLLAAQAGCHLDGSLDVVDVGVNAAVGHQAVDVDSAACFLGSQHSILIGLVLEESTVLDGLGDLGQVLEHDTACTDVGVTDLGVTHLALRQTHVHTGCGQLGAGVLSKDLVQVGLCGVGDSVAVELVGQTVAVHDDESSRSFHNRPLFGSC